MDKRFLIVNKAEREFVGRAYLRRGDAVNKARQHHKFYKHDCLVMEVDSLGNVQVVFDTEK